jgi:hypothetical protein
MDTMKNQQASKSAKGVTDLRRFSDAALLIHGTRMPVILLRTSSSDAPELQRPPVQ